MGLDGEASDRKIGQSGRGPVACSTPITHKVSNTQEQVADLDTVSYPTHRHTAQAHDTNDTMQNFMPSTSPANATPTQTCSGGCLDASRLNVVVHADARPPPFFRGDHTDTCTVHEWEDLMQSYMRRRKCDTAEKYDVITSRLMGKARDIVKVSLRSNAEVDPYSCPTAVFDILKQNFSDLPYSSMPMADFYSTLPRMRESALDYWVRLNKAIDIADECLRRQGKCVEDVCAEVVMMFVTHCPDPHLAMSFKYKSARKWTASEIQERLDEHQRDLRRGTSVSQHSSSIYSPPPVAVSQSPAQFNILSEKEELMGPVLRQPPAAVSMAVNHAEEEPGMREVVGMLNKVITLCSTQSLSQNVQPLYRQRPARPSVSSACEVCSSTDHSTFSHCRLLKLCCHCFLAGHFKNNCPSASRQGAASAKPSHKPLN